jgi:hypothetical protein
MSRPYFNNPIPRTGTPSFPELSTLASPREPDSIARSHYKQNDNTYNLTQVYHAIRQLNSQVSRLRIRQGGQSTGGASSIPFRGEYNPTLAYNVLDIVVVSGGPNAGSFICIQANTGDAPVIPDTGNLYWVSLSGNVPVMGCWLT